VSVPVIAVPELSRLAGTIAARYFRDPSRRLRVVGVTGTNGKTSIAHLVAGAFEALNEVAGVLGTLGAGRPGRLHAVTHTTADAVRVQAQLSELEAERARRVAMEVSSHGLVQHRVDAVCFAGAIFSNLSHDHLDYHGDENAYAAAKRRLFQHPELEWAVINADDPRGREMASALRPGIRLINLSREEIAASAGDAVHYRVGLDRSGMEVTIDGALGAATIASHWMGRFNAFNLTAAFAALRLEGIAADRAAAALEQVPPVPGRMERFGGGRQPTVIVDYAHTPDALQKALESLRDHGPGRLWVVFGCGGDRDRAKRPLMGQVAARLADEVVVTDDNPRSEPGEQIVADILRGAGRKARVCRDRGEAIEQAVTRARPGDIVLVAGKGHESEQIVAEQRLVFSDRDAVRRALGEAGS
jgi:UDP-N-acetylmuramoyl-L-alanyl-D-glutamate--2,6-diaminopimelate ligase